MKRREKMLSLGVLGFALLGGLSGCGKDALTDDPRHDAQTEATRERDCSDPQWKEANLGLWYNICSATQR